jgi:hypothetical protein
MNRAGTTGGRYMAEKRRITADEAQKEFRDYYTRLDTLDAEADAFWAPRR